MFLNNIWIVYPFRCYTIYIINNKKMRLKNKKSDDSGGVRTYTPEEIGA